MIIKNFLYCCRKPMKPSIRVYIAYRVVCRVCIQTAICGTSRGGFMSKNKYLHFFRMYSSKFFEYKSIFNPGVRGLVFLQLFIAAQITVLYHPAWICLLFLLRFLQFLIRLYGHKYTSLHIYPILQKEDLSKHICSLNTHQFPMH